MSSRPPPITPPQILAELKSIGEEEPEEITSTTLQAISAVVEDSKRPSDTKSFLALIAFVNKKISPVSARVRRIELLIIALFGGSVAIGLAWEVFKTFYLHK